MNNMNTLEAMQVRHSVRQFEDRPIEESILSSLKNEIDACNKEGHLHIQLVTNEPEAFSGTMAHYGKFSGVRNYLALIGEKSSDLEERCGYYGERIVLLAQAAGLNSCWVALTFSKGAAKKNLEIKKGEKLTVVIALGYGATKGVSHKSKPMAELSTADGQMPDWFKSGMEAAMLAPTAMNQQKFRITLSGDTAKAESLGGFYSKIDLGIVKYHFEIGSGRKAV